MAFWKAGILTFSVFLCFNFLTEASITRDVAPPMMMPPLFNFGLEHGDTLLDDTNNKIELPFNISYFGTSYKTLHVSHDGLLSFDKPFNYMESVKWWEGVRKSSIDQPFIAPFYYSGFPSHLHDTHSYQGEILYKVLDASTLNANNDQHYSEHKALITYLSSYLPATVVNPPSHFNASVVIIVTWVNVAAKQNDANIECTKNSPCPGATFQAVLAANRDTTFVIFNYKNMTIPLHETFLAGFNGGFNRGWYDVIPCHGKCGLARNVSVLNDLPNLKGSDHHGRFILNVGNELIIRGGCLPSEIKAGMLEMFPLEVGMFGGEKLQVSGQWQQSGHTIYCKFGDDQHVTKGAMTNELKGICPVPLMTRIGPVRVYWSSDGINWSCDNIITVVLPEKVDLSHTIPADVKKAWYSRDAERITLQWDHSKLSSSPNTKLNIKLLGYREQEHTVEYKVLEHFGEVRNTDGSFHFEVATHQCKTSCRDYEIGLFEIALIDDYHLDAAERVAIRYGPFPLGWYVNKKLTEEKSSDWSDDLCLEWHDKDSSQKGWLDDLIPCPCNLDQALSDFGRFQADPSCNLYTGSKCHYHTEAKHCVRSIVTTKDGAGNQCCYGRDGHLIYSQLSFQGSTPDRSHVWGAAPYGSPNLIPSLSHWKHDVVSYYYCCLWNENRLCRKYMELRPTADCKKYEPPGIGFLRGDPHITTFDGQTYTFIGGGDFWLVRIPREVSIQGRFSSSPKAWDIGMRSQSSSWQPRALTSLVIVNERGSEVIEIHPAPERTVRPHGLDIRVGQTRKFFFNESELWQDFVGFSIVNNVLPGQVNKHDNFTVLLTNNIGVNVYGVNGLLHVMVALPPNLKRKDKGFGLLGNFDGVIGNDFTFENDGVVSSNSEKSRINDDFAMSWAIHNKTESLFTFSKEADSSDSHHKYFEVKDIPTNFQDAITSGQASSVCGQNEHCSYDYHITGNIDIARATLAADNALYYVRASIYKADNCGLPEIGGMAELDNYNFSVGQEVRVKDCKEGRYLNNKDARFQCVREKADEAKEHERDYGDKIHDPKDNVEYIIHWIPRPMAVCTDTSEAGLGLYIGIGVGAGVLVIIVIIIVVVCLCRRKKSGKASTGSEKPTPAGRKKKDPVKDPGAAEAMLDQVTQRSPVYKPSQDAVRMSEVQGSNV